MNEMENTHGGKDVGMQELLDRIGLLESRVKQLESLVSIGERHLRNS